MDSSKMGEEEPLEFSDIETGAEPVVKKKTLADALKSRNFIRMAVIVAIAIVGAVFAVSNSLSKNSEAERKNIQKAKEAQNTQIILHAGNESNLLRDEVIKENEMRVGSGHQPILVSPHDEFEFDVVGCSSSDTLCMRKEGSIGETECAPQDSICEALAEAKMLSEAKTPEEPIQPTTNENNYYARLAANADYMDELAKTRSKLNSDSGSDGTKGISITAPKVQPIQSVGNLVSTDEGSIYVNTSVNNNSAIESLEAPAKIVGRRIARMTDEFMGISRIALNSKIESVVSFDIISGTLAGSRASGRSTVVHEYLKVELDNILLADGRECRMDGIALDMETTLAAVRSKIDRHVLYRYGFWGLGTTLSAIGEGAKLVSNKETLVIGGGTAIVSERSDVNREIRIAIGKLGTDMGEAFKNRLNTPPTITLKINEEVGVFLNKSIMDSDCISVSSDYE